MFLFSFQFNFSLYLQDLNNAVKIKDFKPYYYYFLHHTYYKVIPDLYKLKEKRLDFLKTISEF
jgi:hypothetical protein